MRGVRMKRWLRPGVEAPRARSAELVVEEVGDELLVYDVERGVAHCLRSQAATVWRHCDGSRSLEELSTLLDLEPDVVEQALAELAACHLIDTPDPTAGYSRREAARKIVTSTMAVAVGAPLILSVTPSTASAACDRTLGQSCNANHTCCTPHRCVGGICQ